MHGKKLFELAKLVGLTQSAVARHLSISRVQVHYWAQGHRAIPVHYLHPLMELLFQAVKAFLIAGHADTDEAWEGSSILGRLVGESPLRRHIEDVFYDCGLGTMELRGVGPSASITTLAAEMHTYATVHAGKLSKPEHAHHMLELNVKLKFQIEMLVRLGPLLELVADDAVPQDQTSTEPAA